MQRKAEKAHEPSGEHDTQPDRPRIIALALIVAFIVLIGALDQFELAPGARIAPTLADTVDQAFGTMDRNERNVASGSLFSTIVSTVVGLSAILFVIGLLRKENRFSMIVLVLLGAGAVILFTNLNFSTSPPEDPVLAGGDLVPETGLGGFGEAMDAEDAVDVTPVRQTESSPWGWAIALPALVALFFVIRPSFTRQKKETDEAGELEESVRRAVAEADTGKDISDVVIRCYRDMVGILERSKSVTRTAGMTPREFLDRLAGLGVDMAHVQELTRLFERARYDNTALTEDQTREALVHLGALADALGKSRA